MDKFYPMLGCEALKKELIENYMESGLDAWRASLRGCAITMTHLINIAPGQPRNFVFETFPMKNRLVHAEKIWGWYPGSIRRKLYACGSLYLGRYFLAQGKNEQWLVGKQKKGVDLSYKA
jgi:hypothetical protein